MNEKQVQYLYSDIGFLIAEGRRKRRGGRITQTRLAQLLEISRASVVNIERGRHRLSVHLLYAIAEALGLLPVDLLPPQPKFDSELPSAITEKLHPNELPRVANVLSSILKEASKHEQPKKQRSSGGTIEKVGNKKGANAPRKSGKGA